MQIRYAARVLSLLILLGLLAACGLAQPYPLQSDLGRYAQATTVATFGPVIVPPTTAPTNVPPTVVLPTAPGAAPTITPTPTTAPTSTPLPTLRSEMMGIQAYANLQQDLWPGILDRAQFMGFKWIKVQLSWKELEPVSKGTFSPQMAVLRENIIGAGRRSFKVLVSIAKTPDWARPANARGQQDGPPANPQDLADFINAVFNDFGPSAVYMSAIEIWNEPNTVTEWTGALLDGATYMKYFNAAYKAIRARNATMPIISAGPAPTVDNPNKSVDDRKWLDQIYKAGLPKDDPNVAIGVHPYGWANPPEARCCATQSKGWDNHPSFFFLDTLYTYRDIMAKNNHSQAKLWATEFGWATFKGLHYQDHIKGPPAMPPTNPDLAWMNVIDEIQQAAYVVRAFNMAQTGDLATFMGPMFLWNMNFATLPGFVNADKPSLPEAGYSILDSDWNTRPIYNVIQAAPKQ